MGYVDTARTCKNLCLVIILSGFNHNKLREVYNTTTKMTLRKSRPTLRDLYASYRAFLFYLNVNTKGACVDLVVRVRAYTHTPTHRHLV